MTPWLHLIHIFVFFHSLRRYGKKWTFLFLLIGFTIGLASEHVGARYGWVFGKFHYQPDRLTFFGTVPIFTPLSWWLILYCAYNTTNLVLGWGAETGGLPRARRYLALFLSACLDGLMAMNLDMLFDPIMVCPERRRWVWETGGNYFGIPIQNFVGWFLVGFTISLLIRAYDLRTGRLVPLGGRLLDYFPTGLYFAMFLLFSLLSCLDGYPHYALIGFACMMPFVLSASVRAVLLLRPGGETPPARGKGPAG